MGRKSKPEKQQRAKFVQNRCLVSDEKVQLPIIYFLKKI